MVMLRHKMTTLANGGSGHGETHRGFESLPFLRGVRIAHQVLARWQCQTEFSDVPRPKMSIIFICGTNSPGKQLTMKARQSRRAS